VALGSFRFDYEYDYEYEIRQAKRMLYAYAIPVLTRKSRSRRPSEYEIVEKSRSPHDDFFCFPKIICSIYIAFIRRK
jgi:hypothetical protein